MATQAAQPTIGRRSGVLAFAAPVLPELAILTVVVMWSSTGVAIKDIYTYFTPLAFASLRFMIISLMACGILAYHHIKTGESVRISLADWPRMMLAGLTGYSLDQLCYVLGLRHTTAFANSILGSTMPIFTIVLLALLGERSRLAAWIGVAVSFAGGIVFILGSSNSAGGSLLGDLLSIGAPLAFATYSIIGRPLVVKYPPAVFSAYSVVIGTIPILLIGMHETRAQHWGSIPFHVWLMFAYLTIFPVYFAYQLFNYSVRHRGVATVSGYTLATPVLTGVLAWLWLGESMTIAKLAGGAIVIGGLIIMRRGGKTA